MAHHRHQAAEKQGVSEVPVYKGTFTGKAQLPKKELRKEAGLRGVLEKIAEEYIFNTRNFQHMNNINKLAQSVGR